MKLSIVVKKAEGLLHDIDGKVDPDSIKSEIVASSAGIADFKTTMKTGQYDWVVGCYSL